MFPTKYKAAVVTPLLKKSGLDQESPAYYLPISNLNNFSKILEKLLHIISCPNFNQLQSAYRPLHSKETALLHTLDHIYRASDHGRPTALVSIDLSSAFDMVDHTILLHRLDSSFGISGATFSWIRSYLNGRSQCVRAGQSASPYRECLSGVPQSSVLGPLLFSAYVSPIGFIASDHGISLQQYADDTQLHISVSTADLTVNLSTLESCLQSLHCWLCHNSLTLNSNKSDTILFGTANMRKFPSIPGINIAGNLVPLSDKIVTLGVTLDCRLVLSDHISNVCCAAHFHICALRHIRSVLTEDMGKAVAVSMVHLHLVWSSSRRYSCTRFSVRQLHRTLPTCVNPCQ